MLNTILDNMGNIVAVFDLNGIMTFVTPSRQRILGYEKTNGLVAIRSILFIPTTGSRSSSPSIHPRRRQRDGAIPFSDKLFVDVFTTDEKPVPPGTKGSEPCALRPVWCESGIYFPISDNWLLFMIDQNKYERGHL